MKKFLSVIIAAALVMSVFANTVAAADISGIPEIPEIRLDPHEEVIESYPGTPEAPAFPQEQLWNVDYANGETSGQCGDSAYWEFDEETGALKITGTGAIYDYYSYPYAPWYLYGYSILSLDIADGITRIGDRAFFNLYYLGSDGSAVVIPDSVTELGEGAFSYCSSLENITLSANLETIRYDAFWSCDSLEKIIIPASVKTIEADAFKGSPEQKVYFEGNAPAVNTRNGYSNSGQSFDTSDILYVNKTATGWFDSSAFNSKTGLWNGYAINYNDPSHVHTSAADYTSDDSGHWKLCTECGLACETVSSHDYDENKLCQTCGFKHEHTYGNYWNYDAEGHYRNCSVCYEASESEPHEMKYGGCVICRYGKFDFSFVVLADFIGKTEKETIDQFAEWFGADSITEQSDGSASPTVTSYIVSFADNALRVNFNTASGIVTRISTNGNSTNGVKAVESLGSYSTVELLNQFIKSSGYETSVNKNDATWACEGGKYYTVSIFAGKAVITYSYQNYKWNYDPQTGSSGYVLVPDDQMGSQTANLSYIEYYREVSFNVNLGELLGMTVDGAVAKLSEWFGGENVTISGTNYYAPGYTCEGRDFIRASFRTGIGANSQNGYVSAETLNDEVRQVYVYVYGNSLTTKSSEIPQLASGWPAVMSYDDFNKKIAGMGSNVVSNRYDASEMTGLEGAFSESYLVFIGSTVITYNYSNYVANYSSTGTTYRLCTDQELAERGVRADYAAKVRTISGNYSSVCLSDLVGMTESAAKTKLAEWFGTQSVYTGKFMGYNTIGIAVYDLYNKTPIIGGALLYAANGKIVAAKYNEQASLSSWGYSNLYESQAGGAVAHDQLPIRGPYAYIMSIINANGYKYEVTETPLSVSGLTGAKGYIMEITDGSLKVEYSYTNYVMTIDRKYVLLEDINQANAVMTIIYSGNPLFISETVDGVTYTINSNTGEIVSINISSWSGEIKLTIPEKIGGVTVTGISAAINESGVTNYFYAVTEITLPKTVKSIDPDAFKLFTGLKVIYFEGTEAQWGRVVGAAEAVPGDVEVICAPAPDFILGDVNGDGEVKNNDAVLLLRYLAGYDVENFVPEAADIDGQDGIKNNDAVLLLRMLASGQH